MSKHSKKHEVEATAEDVAAETLPAEEQPQYVDPGAPVYAKEEVCTCTHTDKENGFCKHC